MGKTHSVEKKIKGVPTAASMKAKHWSELEELGVMFGIRFMLWVYKVLGERVFSVFLYPVIFYFYLFNGNARRASTDFLQQVYRYAGNQSCFGKLPGWRESFWHFVCFGRSLLDKLKSWMGVITRSELVFDKRPFFKQIIREGRGGLIIASHLGNIEMCRAFGNEVEGLKLNVLVHTRHAENFNRLLEDVNAKASVKLIQVSHIGPDTALLLKDKIDRGEFVVIVGDRTPVSRGRQVMANFLGRPAAFPYGPFVIANLMKCPVYLLFCVKDNNQFRMFVEVFSERIKLPRQVREEALAELVERYARRLEHYAVCYPYQWFNFFDFWCLDRGG